jgi:ABC-type bacteriocin/lantibiotic exporter with double-glycine peptidase domain
MVSELVEKFVNGPTLLLFMLIVIVVLVIAVVIMAKSFKKVITEEIKNSTVAMNNVSNSIVGMKETMKDMHELLLQFLVKKNG